MVLAGGVIAAILGPALAAWSKNLFPTLFAGSYLMVFLLGVGSMLVLAFGFRDVEAEKIPADEAAAARSLTTVFRQPISLAALANNVIGGVVMMFVMTAAPLAAVASHHSIDDGANIIQWHLVGMFAPSFVAGHLIKRYGMPSVLFAGILLSAACTFIAAASPSLPAFYAALLCLGVGWNFMFVGGTALLASSHTPAERAKVQGVAELIRNIFTGAASLVAGPILERFGWVDLNLVNVPLLIIATALTLFWMRSQHTLSRTSNDSESSVSLNAD
jgi:MFS family permease